MFVMYDSTELDQIPAHASAVAGYTSGNWPTYGAIVKRWPHAQHLSIAINAAHDADCLDVEKDDASISDAPGWFHRQKGRPTLYTSLSNVGVLTTEMSHAGIARHEYKIWSAHYTGVPHICGPSEGLSVAAEATQWTNRALGRNLDESLCSDAFFAPPTNPLDVLLEPERRLVNTYDAYLKHPREHAHGLKVTREAMTVLRKKIWLAANATKPPDWKTRNRKARYVALRERTR